MHNLLPQLSKLCYALFAGLQVPGVPGVLWHSVRSVVEFQRWWVLKSMILTQESTCSKEILITTTAALSQVFPPYSLQCFHSLFEVRLNFLCSLQFYTGFTSWMRTIIQKNSGRVPRRASQVSALCCTSWVKRWSEAMDFLQTIFKTNDHVVRKSKGMQKNSKI